jgi:hypothetical protein
MSFAFEINTDDVINVLFRKGLTLPEERIEEIFFSLDFHAIEQAALHHLDMDQQISSAYAEIENQLQTQILI